MLVTSVPELRRERSASRALRIELTGVSKRFITPSGDTFTALRDVDLKIEPGQFCAVVGPTGCGKSTTLTLVSGLDRPNGGSVTVNGTQVSGITQGTSFMFQADALMPWKTVVANVMMGPLFHGASKREARERATDWLRRV